jgi:hypothetical protein
MRHGVTSDWKFFLDDEEWLNFWAHRLEAASSERATFAGSFWTIAWCVFRLAPPSPRQAT